jgi:hypothetical protein
MMHSPLNWASWNLRSRVVNEGKRVASDLYNNRLRGDVTASAVFLTDHIVRRTAPRAEERLRMPTIVRRAAPDGSAEMRPAVVSVIALARPDGQHAVVEVAGANPGTAFTATCGGRRQCANMEADWRHPWPIANETPRRYRATLVLPSSPCHQRFDRVRALGGRIGEHASHAFGHDNVILDAYTDAA